MPAPLGTDFLSGGATVILRRALVRFEGDPRVTDASDAEALNMAQEENRALNRIIEVFSSGIDLERVLTAAVDLVLETTGVDACFLHLYEPDNGGGRQPALASQ